MLAIDASTRGQALAAACIAFAREYALNNVTAVPPITAAGAHAGGSTYDVPPALQSHKKAASPTFDAA